MLKTCPSDLVEWPDVFSGFYRCQRHRAQQQRQRRRDRRSKASPGREAECQEALIRIQARMPPADAACLFARGQFISKQAAHGDPDAKLLYRVGEGQCWRELHLARQASLQTRITARLRGKHGLRSDEHAILQLFVASTPRAARLKTGDDKAIVHTVGSKLLGLDEAYVHTNPTMCRVLRVELDQDFAGGFDALAVELARLNVPLPNIVVGHVDQHGVVRHPHLIWLLGDAIPFTPRGRSAPQWIWRATLKALTAALLSIGADPGGISNALRMKNPLSPSWDCAVLASAPYCLKRDPTGRSPMYQELASQLDLRGAKAALRSAGKSQSSRPVTADHPDPYVAGQSNAVFDVIRQVAYACVRRFRDEGHGSREEFTQHLVAEALAMALVSSTRAAERVARSVASWTWENYHPGTFRPSALTPDERRARYVAGQAKGAASRSAATLERFIAVTREIVSENLRVTQAEVARRTGKSPVTIRKHWPAVVAALGRTATPRNRQFSPSADKKDCLDGTLGTVSCANVENDPRKHGRGLLEPLRASHAGHLTGREKWPLNAAGDSHSAALGSASAVAGRTRRCFAACRMAVGSMSGAAPGATRATASRVGRTCWSSGACASRAPCWRRPI